VRQNQAGNKRWSERGAGRWRTNFSDSQDWAAAAGGKAIQLGVDIEMN